MPAVPPSRATSGLSQKTCSLSTWPGVWLLLPLPFLPYKRVKKKGHPGTSLHGAILFLNFFLPSNKVLDFADFTSDSFHRSSMPFIPICFTLGLQRTLKHTRNEVTGACSFLYPHFQADYSLEPYPSMWNHMTQRLQSQTPEVRPPGYESQCHHLQILPVHKLFRLLNASVSTSIKWG